MDVIYRHPNEMQLTVKQVPPTEAKQYRLGQRQRTVEGSASVSRVGWSGFGARTVTGVGIGLGSGSAPPQETIRRAVSRLQKIIDVLVRFNEGTNNPLPNASSHSAQLCL